MLRDPALLIFLTHHEPTDVLKKEERDPALVTQFDEVRALQRGFAEKHSVVRDDSDQVTADASEPGYERRPKLLLELEEPTAIGYSRDHLADVVRGPEVRRHDADEIGRIMRRRLRWRDVPRRERLLSERRDDLSHDSEGMQVIVRDVVDDSGDSRVHVASPELLGGNDLSRRRSYEGWASEEDRALLANDDRLVAHRWDVRASRGR